MEQIFWPIAWACGIILVVAFTFAVLQKFYHQYVEAIVKHKNTVDGLTS